MGGSMLPLKSGVVPTSSAVRACDHTESPLELRARLQRGYLRGTWLEGGAFIEHSGKKTAGIEPLLPENPNPMMTNDFGFYCAKTLELPHCFFSPGVLPSLGDAGIT
jgi:hypothetical protein